MPTFWGQAPHPEGRSSSSPQNVLYRRSRLAPKARGHVGACIQHRRDVGVAQKLLDECGADTLGEEEASTGVPEIVTTSRVGE